MNKIKILPDQIVNKIAAERLRQPSSAKEIIENSIDATQKNCNQCKRRRKD